MRLIGGLVGADDETLIVDAESNGHLRIGCVELGEASNLAKDKAVGSGHILENADDGRSIVDVLRGGQESAGNCDRKENTCGVNESSRRSSRGENHSSQIARVVEAKHLGGIHEGNGDVDELAVVQIEAVCGFIRELVIAPHLAVIVDLRCNVWSTPPSTAAGLLMIV